MRRVKMRLHSDPLREFARQRPEVAARIMLRVEGQSQPARELGAGESRLHFRSSLKHRWPVELRPVRPTSAWRVPGRVRAETLGVSLGGTFVVSEDPLPVDTDLHLWLHLPPSFQGPTVLRLLARVRWINQVAGEIPRGFGVAFRALTAADEIALHSGFSRSAKVV